MLAVEENGEIPDEGKNKDREVNFYMMVYVETTNGKTIGIKCDRRQSIVRIMDDVARKTRIPKDLQYLVNQGKAMNEKKTFEESNIEAETTIEMTLRPQGGMKNHEPMASAGTKRDK